MEILFLSKLQSVSRFPWCIKFPHAAIAVLYFATIKTVIVVDNGTNVRIKPYPGLKLKAVTELIVVNVGPVPFAVR